MNPIAAGFAAFAFTLGGVPVDITTAAPAEPTAEASGYLWPTDKVYPNQPIRMADGAIWKVKIVRTAADGAITVEVRPNLTQSRNSKITVRAENVQVPIWWSTLEFYIPPEGDTEIIGEGIPPEPEPTPPPVQDPGGPTPAPTEEPTIPPVDPGAGN